ncbi:hypothetical protein TRVL_04391 [Trypanosoma vivax]|nr:hypothetical protein TRVL_04391 [Trypanosoma vivax]
MVLLAVKGTTFPDEFVYECAASTSIYPDLAQRLCHIQNMRHLVKLQLLSARELLEEARRKRGAVVKDEDCGKSDSEYCALLNDYDSAIESTSLRLKDKAAPVTFDEFDTYAEKLRDLTERLYPAECRVSEGGRTAAVDRLYQLYEDPDIGEDMRLIVYHCRAILDPKWRSHEHQQEDKAGLWFCGKLMEDTVGKYSGRNEKSRLTVKVHPRDGAPPSTEPRISYEDQRALFERMRARREEYKVLEESELRDRVVAQARGKVALATLMAGGGAETIIGTDFSKLRPICPKREEREVI